MNAGASVTGHRASVGLGDLNHHPITSCLLPRSLLISFPLRAGVIRFLLHFHISGLTGLFGKAKHGITIHKSEWKLSQIFDFLVNRAGI